jgi:hypothetical protein
VRISQKQLWVLVDVLKWTVSKVDGNCGGYSNETRASILHQIINQQSDTLVDIPHDNDGEIKWNWDDLNSSDELPGGEAKGD